MLLFDMLVDLLAFTRCRPKYVCFRVLHAFCTHVSLLCVCVRLVDVYYGKCTTGTPPITAEVAAAAAAASADAAAVHKGRMRCFGLAVFNVLAVFCSVTCVLCNLGPFGLPIWVVHLGPDRRNN